MTVLQPLAEIDESAIKERINSTLKMLGTNDNLAEFYVELRDQVAVQRARLAESILFETNMMTAIENHFKAVMESADAKRLPAEAFEIECDQKYVTEYDAEALFDELKAVLPESQFSDAVYIVPVVKTNGVKINKLVRSFGEKSPVGLAVSRHSQRIASGKAKLKIERRETAPQMVNP